MCMKKAKHHLLTVFFSVLHLALSAQKTDVVILKNGDHLTGEIKKLDLDILQFKTSTMSTVQIKWYQVSNIFAPDKFVQVELEDKTKIYGSLDSINIPNALRIVSNEGEFNVPVDNVVGITQVKRVFWSRFSGNLGAGLSYTKASDVLQSNFNAYISYTDELYFSAIDVNSIRTQQPERITAKQDLMLNVNRATVGRQFATVFTGIQQNTELDIQNRTWVGAGYGVDLLHTNIARIRFILGGIGNEETTISEGNSTNNGEGLVALDARVFKYTDPEVYLTAGANYYPSFTVENRHRLELTLKIRFELLNNFFIEFQVYDNYDSKPASEEAANNDYGLVGSLQYTFGL